MNKLFGIVEIGSTNTKAYECENDSIIELGFKTIEFKKNYSYNSSLLTSDIDTLVQFIKSVFDSKTEIYVYATSVFRELDQQNVEAFEETLKRDTSVVSVDVVSTEMENKLTVIGAINNVTLDGNVCVFVGGGGSTEISICNNGLITEMANSDIGVTDVMKAFPDLMEDVAKTSIDDVTSFITKRLTIPSQKADYLILAGGDFLLRYDNAQYPVDKNTLFTSIDHPYTISYVKNRAFESRYYHEVSLSKIKKTTPDNPNWWNGTRSMCAFTNAVALAIAAKIIIPTRVSMIYGIAAEINGH